MRSATIPLAIAMLMAFHKDVSAAVVDSALHPSSADTFSENLSTNWLSDVRSAIPAAIPENGELGYNEITNLLRQEADRGNNAALGLWGTALIVAAKSASEANLGWKFLRQSAEEGFAPAMCQLGFLYEGSPYVEKDNAEAFRWFSRAAENTNALGLLQLGGCYHYGIGVAIDLPKSYQCYLRSAELTNYVAMKSLGYFLMNGFGCGKDIQAAKHWLTRAAKEGDNRRAMYNLGVIVNMGYADTDSIHEAFEWFRQSAERGDSLACYQLSQFYYYGFGAQSNIDNYRYWRSKAASLGSTKAQYLMGAACRLGDGVPRDIEASLTWYHAAAAKNDPRALYDLALLSMEDGTNVTAMAAATNYMLRAARGGHLAAQFWCGLNLPKQSERNCEEGLRWLMKSASNGWARAEFVLFQLYNGAVLSRNCSPLSVNKEEGSKWLRRSAERGDIQAQSTLAVMLIQGRDVPQNRAEAEELLRYAAEHGHSSAQNDLGFGILSGALTAKDALEGAVWLNIAYSQSTKPDSAEQLQLNLTKALSQLTEDQRQEVANRAAVFRPLPVPDIDPMEANWDEKPAFKAEDGARN